MSLSETSTPAGSLIPPGSAPLPLIVNGNIGGATVQTVDARHLHAFLGVGKDFSTWIKDRIDQFGFVENQDFVVFTEIGENPSGGRPAKEYALALDMAKELSMVERNEKGKQARLHFIECERQAKTLASAVPNFSDPAAAARAWADQYEARLLAERTKAEIGSRREATAMNTASQAVKTANKLRIDLDRSKEYATVKRMQMIYHGQPFDWRLLKATAAQIGIPPVKVFDPNFDTVNAYHADVWREAYALEIEEARDLGVRQGEAAPTSIRPSAPDFNDPLEHPGSG